MQSATLQADAPAGGNADQQWRQQVFPLCRQTVEAAILLPRGRTYDGPELAGLFGPQGILSVFIQQNALPYLETDQTPVALEARGPVRGLNPDSAPFLNAAQISKGLFGAGGASNTR